LIIFLLFSYWHLSIPFTNTLPM